MNFASADALHLEGLGRKFDAVIDCGLFHTFDAEERSEYAASLARVTEAGGTVFVLCLSEQRRVGSGWHWGERIETRFHDHEAPAWLPPGSRRGLGEEA